MKTLLVFCLFGSILLSGCVGEKPTEINQAHYFSGEYRSPCYGSRAYSVVSHLDSNILVAVLDNENKVVSLYLPKKNCNLPCKKTDTGFDCTDNCWNATYETIYYCQSCDCLIPENYLRLFVGDLNNLIPIRDSNHWVKE